MGRWTDYEIQRDFTDWPDLCDTHNADCDAYEKRIAEMEERVAWANEITKAQLDLTGGKACKAARDAGRDACGCCAWCVGRARDQLAAAIATLERLREVVPEDADGWCYECGNIVTTYHYGGSGNPQCAKCRSSKTDCLPSGLEEFLPKIHAILYPQETGNGN